MLRQQCIWFLCFLVIGSMFLQNAAAGPEHPELKAFPPVKDGMQRFVIVLTPMEGKEDSFKVEIIPGKTMLTDGVNLTRLGTTVEQRTRMG